MQAGRIIIRSCSRIQLIILFIHSYTLSAQQPTGLMLPEPKRFIGKVEIFAGPNLSFNYGNMFIENYRGEYTDGNYVMNQRLLKPGYAFGIGVYHSLNNKMDLNARIKFETKGTRSELNNPLNPVNDDARQVTRSNYTYNYFTINISPILYLGRKERWLFSFGGYYSKIKNVKGSSETYDTRDYRVNKGSFVGRYFYHLREDGGRDGFSWTPFLTGIEAYDYGIISSIGYRMFVGERFVGIQLQDNLGIKNINKKNTYGLEEKNHSLALIISYNFKCSPKK